MTDFPYALTPMTEVRLGLIVLQSDESLEHDLRRLIPTDVNLLTTRIPSGADVTEDTLGQMAQDLPAAAKLLPQNHKFATIGYGCTSGAAVIGPQRVADLVRSAVPTQAVTDPVTALIAACQTLEIKRLGILSPYIADVSRHLRAVLAQHGIDTPVFGSFNEAAEERVARISPASIRSAALALSARGGFDALFLSCTNLRTLDLIAPLEAALNMPVLSSNQVLAWHLMRLSGILAHSSDHGKLLSGH